jgi:hypothetical protein
MRNFIDMKIVLFVIFSIIQLIAHAQMDMDSLRSSLSHEKDDSSSIMKNLEKIETLYVTDVEPLLMICDWAISKAKKINNKYCEAYGYMAKGFSYLYNDNAGEEPAQNFINALRIAEPEKYMDICAQTYNGLATVYKMGRQLGKYEEFMLRSIEASKQIGLEKGISHGYAGLAVAIFEKDKNDPANVQHAITYQRLAIASSERIKDSSSLIIYYLSFANYLSQAQMFDSSSYYLERSRSIIDKKNSGNDYMSYYYHKGTRALRMANFAEATRDYLSAMEYAVKYQSRSYQSRINKALYQTFARAGNSAKALSYLEKVKHYEDSALTAENFAKATDIQNKYQRERKENELLQKDLALKSESARRNKITLLLITSLIALLAFGVLIFFLLKSIGSRKKAYAQLEKKNEEIKEQALQLSQQARLIAKFQSQMNPHFTFNALHNIYGLVATKDNEMAIQQIQALAGLMRQTLTNSVKEEISLTEEISYLRKYIDFEKATAAAPFEFFIEVDSELEDAVIPPMMIQPFIENAVKHAQLDKTPNPFVKVFIEKERDLMKLIIQDNGKGLDKNAGNLSRLSHSISIVRSRIDLLFQDSSRGTQNNFRIISTPQLDRGTSVEFYLPLNYTY